MASRKLTAALTAGVLFFVVSSPMLYKLVDDLVGGLLNFVNPRYTQMLRVAELGKPTTYGLFLHSAVFATIVYYMMKH